MRIITLITALVVGFMLLAGQTMAQDADDGYGHQKVVYHINYAGGEGNKLYKGAMRNIQNHINAVGEKNIELKVVMHGNGVGLLQAAQMDPQMAVVVDNLKLQDVVFLVCANTLRSRNIDYQTQLYDVVERDIVPSGVAELSRLQQQGYTYIKP